MTMSPPSPSPAEVPQWLKSLPLAPEYHPSPAEFQDPIAYILKIEREASSFGICKIVPPLPAPPRKSCVSHLARSFPRRTFTTRQQHLGLCPRRPRPVQKPVWQSGEDYTLPRFEAKARNFERSVLRCAPCAELDIEALFWKAAADRPVVVEYANDIPGSGFAPPRPRGSLRWKEEDVGDTAWNMRRVSREKGSLLRFMREEIPGVTSPMVYVAMLFSWFAWHVEDHELHSLNYLHMGASKTWYGVPRDARFAFEEVVRVQGYGGDVNPLVTFALLGEKTTVMSPEVLLGAGIPCCRLVQNAGDFVVTFPGSYHCGFSHGYNCGEASNIATPEWLKVAKEAAIRRASINVPPMVSHYQLLFELAMSLWSRKTLSGAPEPRSSRLKDKLRGEGEVMIKELFVQSIMENNNLLYTLLDNGSSCVVLPQSGYGGPFNSSSQSRTQMKIKTKPSVFSCDREETQEDSREEPSPEPILDSDASHGLRNHSLSAKKHPSVGSTESCTSSDSENMHQEKEKAMNGEGLLDQGLLSCVTCGILSYACVAIVQPTERAAVFLMSANSGTFLDQLVTTSEVCYGNKDTYLKSGCAQTGISDFSNNNCEAFGDNLGHSHDHQVDAVDHKAEPTFVSAAHDGPSALDLLASAYGNLSSDTDEDNVEYEEKSLSGDVIKKELSPLKTHNGIQDFMPTGPLSSLPPTHTSHPPEDLSNNLGAWENSSGNCSFHTDLMESKSPGGFTTDVSPGQSSNDDWIEDDVDQYHSDMNSKQLKSVSPDVCFKMKVMPTMHQPEIEAMPNAYLMNLNATLMQPRPDKDSSRLHVFCLEHALEVQRLLSPFGGVNIMLLCHPDYQIIESQAKLASTELRINYTWKDINFREATGQDRERIKSALDDEEAIPMSSDWAVKMGMNLYYSASLSKSPLYSKQIPYNRVIYKAFGRNSSGNLPGQLKVFERRRGKKSVVAGRWCGKVWMSNQVHPYVTRKTGAEEQNCATTNDPEVENVNDRETNNTDAKLMKPPSVDALDAYSPCAKTSSRKRKKTVEKVNAKKPRHNQQHCYESPEHSAGNSSGQGKMVRRSARTNGTSTALRNESIKAPQHHDSSLDGDLECGPKTRLRSRPLSKGPKTKKTTEEKPMAKKKKQGSAKRSVENDDLKEYPCDIEGCTMSFSLKQDLALHKRNICPVKGCGKKFFSHKYLVQHRRVHTDDRPLKCPWKGCKMSFKWAWARTEHIRVHTGDRPYICMVGGCGQTFRFVSDFSRHKRKTGHISKKVRR